MLKAWLLLGLCGLVSCYITCPDGKMKCKDQASCCLTDRGYKCCPYPNAVCCPDLAHCCPSGFLCNLVTQMCEKQGEPWVNRPLLQEENAVEGPADGADKKLHLQKSSIVYCDNYNTCPDGTTCCRHPKGGWTCCLYSPAHCCLDGFHCCPYGYDCDYTYTYCIRQGLRYPFSSLIPATSQPATPLSADRTPLIALEEATGVQEGGAIRCDSHFYCPKGSSCCKDGGQWSCCPYPLEENAVEGPADGADKKLHLQKSSIVYCDNYNTCPDGTTCCRHPKGGWTCCPYSPAHCCLDGFHCCPYGYDCDYTYTYCIRQGLRYPFSSLIPATSQPATPLSADRTPLIALEEATGVQEGGAIRCDSHFYCPKGSSCCKDGGRWSCCPYPLASCCADGKHCCQFGYICDPDSQMCRNGWSGV